MKYFKNKAKELCSIDIRSLAIFRMGLSLILICDLFVRMMDIKSHYSDEGILPREVLISQVLGPWDFSFHFINGTWGFQLIFFILALFFAITLFLGYKTKISTIASWILLISLHTRNPLVLQGGDTVLRVLLFWSLFLPLGGIWSLDAIKKKAKYTQVASWASLGLLLQVCFIYWFTILLKTDESWRVSGSAVWYALSIEQYATPLGVYLLNFPNLLTFLTFATFYLEAFGPFLAFSPIWTPQLRFLTFVLFALFHMVGLNLTMELAHFSYICTVAWMVFIPQWFWDKVLFKNKEKENVQDAYRGKSYANFFAGVSLAYIFLWNVYTLDKNFPKVPKECEIPGIVFGVNQIWNMFAPYPLREDGWYVIPAVLKDGSRIDLYTNKAISYEKPKLLSAAYKNDRWRSYMMNMFLDDDGPLYLLHYAKYLTKEWNQNHSLEKQVVSFEIEYMCYFNEYNLPKKNPEKILLWHHIVN